MKEKKPKNALEAFEQALKGSEKETYILNLYVAGVRPISVRAVANIKQICERYLKGRYTLEVIDAYQSPDVLAGVQIVAMPTLIKTSPLPMRRIVGDLSDTGRVLSLMGIYPRE
ncbi:MAG: circadian clock KaiB family protein [Deltaproteobacteria bacterium]|nr:circadian clock KaiB family protein [Deltaproteobacteria bacterium]MBW1930678.1 circadian clock KaiB family protein [Deltaproteobacteria bacterium]MBW2026654.1 circadian clock KaiB family protein [Deltaproteobacteria bacterium]MBW2126686.1 circadian clock KaiB family protein [Deltaproteobacteria bacterium]RLB17585.1 MAG: thiol-disulfide isomerase [Deltaproteobacteria bacterium]